MVAEIVSWLQEAIAHFYPKSSYARSLSPELKDRAKQRLFQPPKIGVPVICHPHCGAAPCDAATAHGRTAGVRVLSLWKRRGKAYRRPSRSVTDASFNSTTSEISRYPPDHIRHPFAHKLRGEAPCRDTKPQAGLTDFRTTCQMAGIDAGRNIGAAVSVQVGDGARGGAHAPFVEIGTGSSAWRRSHRRCIDRRSEADLGSRTTISSLRVAVEIGGLDSGYAPSSRRIVDYLTAPRRSLSWM